MPALNMWFGVVFLFCPLAGLADKAAGQAGSGDKGHSKAKKKEKFFIDFDTPVPDWKDSFATSRASTTLAKSTLSRRAEEFLLPIDVQYKVENLTQLFTNSAMKVLHRLDSPLCVCVCV